MKKLFVLFFIIFNLNYITPQSVTFLWWNLQNFFDTEDDPYKNDTVLTEEQYLKKLQLVSGVIKKIDADIVGVCEIENIAVLSNVAKLTGYKYYYLEEGNDPRGIDLALLSKYPAEYKTNIEMLTPYKNNPNYKFSRDCPVAKININNNDIYILLNHLKSMVGDDNTELKRVAQINGILDIIDFIYKNENNPTILLMGDFNSYRHSEPMNILEKSGLIILNYQYNEKTTYTTEFNRNKKDFDYFLVNNNLFKQIKSFNLKTHNNKGFKKISDHYPLFLRIAF